MSEFPCWRASHKMDLFGRKEGTWDVACHSQAVVAMAERFSRSMKVDDLERMRNQWPPERGLEIAPWSKANCELREKMANLCSLSIELHSIKEPSSM